MARTAAAIFGCAGPALPADEAAFFAEAQPWGFILFARNVEDPEQLRRLTGDLREAVGRAAPILIDQEGGRVQRMRAPHWREWLPALEQCRRASDAPRAMELRARLIAEELRGVGIDVNCFPNCDIAEPETHRILRNRCYGADPDTVVTIARAAVRGLAGGGVLPVMKHMPGHGRARVDSHLALPQVSEDAEALHDWDFAPFRALADLPLAMTAHIVFDAIDPLHPATTSPVMQRLIREDIGFDGLLMTDDISMQALSGDMAARSRAARAAGCDIVLHCNGERAEMEQVLTAAGDLEGAALARAEAALAARPDVQPIDIAEAEAELEALLNGRTDG
jgi:beta-N-acetylhexosaminidase